jgi:hypothetical protein
MKTNNRKTGAAVVSKTLFTINYAKQTEIDFDDKIAIASSGDRFRSPAHFRLLFLAKIESEEGKPANPNRPVFVIFTHDFLNGVTVLGRVSRGKARWDLGVYKEWKEWLELPSRYSASLLISRPAYAAIGVIRKALEIPKSKPAAGARKIVE